MRGNADREDRVVAGLRDLYARERQAVPVPPPRTPGVTPRSWMAQGAGARSWSVRSQVAWSVAAALAVCLWFPMELERHEGPLMHRQISQAFQSERAAEEGRELGQRLRLGINAWLGPRAAPANEMRRTE